MIGTCNSAMVAFTFTRSQPVLHIKFALLLHHLSLSSRGRLMTLLDHVAEASENHSTSSLMQAWISEMFLQCKGKLTINMQALLLF